MRAHGGAREWLRVDRAVALELGLPRHAERVEGLGMTRGLRVMDVMRERAWRRQGQRHAVRSMVLEAERESERVLDHGDAIRGLVG